MIMPDESPLQCFQETVNRSVQSPEHIIYSQVHTVKRKKANWIGHILRRICLLQQVIERKIDGRRRRGRRLKQLLDDVKEKRIFGDLKEEES